MLPSLVAWAFRLAADLLSLYTQRDVPKLSPAEEVIRVNSRKVNLNRQGLGPGQGFARGGRQSFGLARLAGEQVQVVLLENHPPFCFWRQP